MQWTRPKSVRQIGGIPGKRRIYMEDYVARFAKELAEQTSSMEKAAVLLGNYYMYNDEKIYQVSGIVEIENFCNRITPELTDEMWDRIFLEIKENFTDLEIVGWFYSGSGFMVHEASKLLEIHRSNFRKGDKILYIYDAKEGEERFFIYRGGQFEQQRGYYIYYEKNPEMLHYMEKEKNRHVHIIEQEDDRVVRNIRGIIREKEKKREQQERRKAHVGRGIVGMVALIAVLVGTVTIKNQTTLDQVKNQLNALQTMAQPKNMEIGKRTVVETKMSNLKKQNTVRPQETPAGITASAVQVTMTATPMAEASQSPVAK